MCGRYTLTTSLDDLVETFQVAEVVLPDHRPRFNVAPTQDAPVIVQGSRGRRLGLLRWGLVPHWAGDPAVGNRMINARSESVRAKPAFRDAFRRRRCVVPADGFYEWQRTGEEPASRRSRKVPHWIHRPGRLPFAIAGLWDRWRPPGAGEPLHTFTVLTTQANETLRPLHDRMPAVLLPEHLHLWLDRETDPERLQALLRPAPDDYLEAWPVAAVVNSPDFDEPRCIEPLPQDDHARRED